MASITSTTKSWGFWLCIYALMTGMPVVSAAGFDRGQALYENHCQYCHESWAHEREGRKVSSKTGLRQMVEAWSIHASLDWSDEEIDAVTNYLDQNFYQFGD